MFVSTFFQLLPSLSKIAFVAGMLLALIYYVRAAIITLQKDWQHLKRLHQIPCDRCIFFTGEYNLKCTVHPYKALNEDAIGCSDYVPGKSS
jgi:hypothetical protein